MMARKHSTWCLQIQKTFVLALLPLLAYTPELAFADSLQTEPRTKVALVVGIAQYEKPPFSNLDWTERDADAVASELRKLGFTVRLLKGSSSGPDKATRTNILQSLDKLVAPLGKDDLAIVMFSGHGQQFKFKEPDPDDPGKLREREDAFFCPVDAVNREPTALVSISHITDTVLANNVGRRILLVDACRDVPKDPNKGARGVQGRVIALPEDTAVLFSCRAGQRSWENDELKHGLFSYCLLEGLRGKASRTDDGAITWNSLLAHVTGRMASNDITRHVPQDARQTPINAGGLEETVLGRVSGAEKLPTTAVVGKALETMRNTVGMELVLIPSGSYRMGSPATESDRDENEDQVDVTLTKPFYLGKTEVTQGQWRSVMGTSPWKEEEYIQEGDNYPAYDVSWEQAQAFCRKLSEKEKGKIYRLPTEAEWEYACRGGTTTAYSFGNDGSKLGDYGWYGGFVDGNAKTEQYPHEVARKKPNPYGLYDMHGNVCEWCEDTWGEKLPGGTDPLLSTGDSYRMCRGGGWSFKAENCRSAYRYGGFRSGRYFYLGFRVALSPSGK